MKRRLILATMLIMAGIGAIIITMAVIGPSYIETPWNDLGCWTTDAPEKPYMDYDSELGDVVRLPGEGATYKYVLKGKGGTPLVTEEEYIHYLSLNLKSEDKLPFYIYVYLETNAGVRYLAYKTDNGYYGRTGYNHGFIGVGADKSDGEWHILILDITGEFNKLFPGEKIFQVKDIVFKANLSVSNIRSYSVLLPDYEITKPKNLAFVQEHFYKDKVKILSIIDYFNEFGWSVGYSNYKYDCWPNGGWKKVEMSNYSPGKILKNCIIYEYSQDGTQTECHFYSGDMKLKSHQLWQHEKEYLSYAKYEYYKDDGAVWFKDDIEHYFKDFCKYINIIYKKPDGSIIKKSNMDNVYEGGYKFTYYTVLDSNDNPILKKTIYHNLNLASAAGGWGLRGVLYEIENYKTGVITWGRNLDVEHTWDTTAIFSELELDYDKNNYPKDIRMIYYGYNPEVNIEKRWIIYYDDEGEQKCLEETKFDPWNLSNYVYERLPELVGEKVLDTKMSCPDNLVMDGKFKEIKPFWKPVGKPIFKKAKEIICGKPEVVLKIEKEYEEEELDEEPVFLQQCMPLKGNKEYKLTVKYIRKSGTAYIKMDWLPMKDVLDTNEIIILEELAGKYAVNLVDYMDDYSIGLQKAEFTFMTPSDLGVVILKVGAGSVILYTNVELKQYILKPIEIVHPVEPEKEVIVGEKAVTQEVEDVLEEVEESLGSDYDLEVVNTEEDSEGNVRSIAQEYYRDTPVYGGYIVVKEDKEGNVEVVEDKIVKTEEPLEPPPEIPTDMKAEFICEVLEEELGVSEDNIEEVIPQYDAELVIAEDDTGCAAFGLHIEGPRVDRVIDIKTHNDLHRIRRKRLSPRRIVVLKRLSLIKRLYLGLRGQLAKLLQMFKKRVERLRPF